MQLTPKLVYTLLILFVSRGNAQQVNAGLEEREYLVATMLKIADPVLNALSKNELKHKMPVEAKTDDRISYT